MIAVVRATREHAAELLPRMRAIDLLECEGMGKDPAVALAEGLEAEAWAALDGAGRVFAIFGVGPLEEGSRVGVPWLVGDDTLAHHALSLVKRGRAYCRAWLEVYDDLFNVCHAGNVDTIRWLQRLGFTIGEPLELGSATWRPFEWRAPAHV